jgi:hypothetical protein
VTDPYLAAHQTRAQLIADRLRTLYGVDVVCAGEWVAWSDGPCVENAAQALHDSGIRYTVQDSGAFDFRDGGHRQILLAREITTTTAILATIRPHVRAQVRAAGGNPDELIADYIDLPATGLTPDSGEEQVAVTLVTDNLDIHDLRNWRTGRGDYLCQSVLNTVSRLGGPDQLLEIGRLATLH